MLDVEWTRETNALKGGVMIQLSLLGEHPELRDAAGAVAIAHGQFEYILQMTVMSLARITGPEAVLATRRLSTRDRRNLIRRLAKTQQLGEPIKLKLDALLERAAL